MTPDGVVGQWQGCRQLRHNIDAIGGDPVHAEVPRSVAMGGAQVQG